MTRLVLEIPNKPDLDLLLPLLRRLGIRIAKTEIEESKPSEIERALRIIEQGCDMSTFGDALQYQIEARQERSLPFRN